MSHPLRDRLVGLEKGDRFTLFERVYEVASASCVEGCTRLYCNDIEDGQHELTIDVGSRKRSVTQEKFRIQMTEHQHKEL